MVLQHVPIFSLIAASWQVASNCQRLEEPGHHPKWQEVNISAELPGWKRYPPAEAWLKRYLVASHSTAGSGSSIDERELRDIFSKFLDERSRLVGSSTMSRQEKDRMFEEFRRWQSALPH